MKHLNLTENDLGAFVPSYMLGYDEMTLVTTVSVSLLTGTSSYLLVMLVWFALMDHAGLEPATTQL